MKNAYAAKLQAQRVHLKNAERSELIHRILTTVYQASAVVLNEQFGFGAERISRFRDAMEQTIIEYAAMLADVDADYADGKLSKRYEQIMGDDAYCPAEQK